MLSLRHAVLNSENDVDNRLCHIVLLVSLFIVLSRMLDFIFFSSMDNMLEMLDMCIKFAEGTSMTQESPPRDPSDAVSLARFLNSKASLSPLLTILQDVCF